MPHISYLVLYYTSIIPGTGSMCKVRTLLTTLVPGTVQVLVLVPRQRVFSTVIIPLTCNPEKSYRVLRSSAPEADVFHIPQPLRRLLVGSTCQLTHRVNPKMPNPIFLSTSSEKPQLLTISFADDPEGSLGAQLINCDKGEPFEMFSPGFAQIGRLLDGNTVAKRCGVKVGTFSRLFSHTTLVGN